MKKNQRAILLAISALVVVALIVISAISLKTPAKEEPKIVLSVNSFTVENMTDHLQLSLCIVDQNDKSVAVNGTATLSIQDNKSATIYQKTFAMTETDFQNVSTSSGAKLMRVWQVNYSEMSESKGGELVCNLQMTSVNWTQDLTAVSNKVGLPASLSIYKLYFVDAMPSDQLSLMAGNKIQAGIMYEPYASDVDRWGGKVMLRSSDVWPNHPSYVLIMNKYWAQSHPDLAARVIRAHMDAEIWIQSALANPGSYNYNYVVSKAMEISGEPQNVVEEALKHIKFNFELTDEAKQYISTYSDGYIQEGIYSINDLHNRGYLNSDAFANAYLDNTYLTLAESIAPTKENVGSVNIGFVKGNIFMLPSAIALDENIWIGKNAFEKYGLQVNIPQPGGYNTSALDAKALMNGSINVAYIAICPALLNHVLYDMQSVIVAQMTAEGTALVVKKSIFSIDELAGKVIASPGSITIQGIFMMVVAEKYGFTLQPKP